MESRGGRGGEFFQLDNEYNKRACIEFGSRASLSCQAHLPTRKVTIDLAIRR